MKTKMTKDADGTLRFSVTENKPMPHTPGPTPLDLAEIVTFARDVIEEQYIGMPEGTFRRDILRPGEKIANNLATAVLQHRELIEASASLLTLAYRIAATSVRGDHANTKALLEIKEAAVAAIAKAEGK